MDSSAQYAPKMISITELPHFIVIKQKDEFIRISRDDLQLLSSTNLKEHHQSKDGINCSIILGIFHLNDLHFLAFATHSERMSQYLEIYSVSKIHIIQIESTKPKCQEAIDLLHEGFSICPMYWSPSSDLTQNLLSQKHRSHFIWNSTAIANADQLFGKSLECTPVIAGHVSCFTTPKYEFLLISRRDRRHCGTRLWQRGADSQGNAANFVETEQIIRLTADGSTFSLVQIRGSVPLSWKQNPDLLLHAPEIDRQKSPSVIRAHYQNMNSEYGKIISVCLTNDKGKEKELTETFRRLGDVTYFNFNQECAHMKYDNVNNLLKRVSADWTELTGTTVHQTQKNVVRTNCLDCQDRTNVVQTYIAKDCAQKQLGQFNLELDESPFRAAWTDTGDAVSLQYSGTGALKTDFTRTGKRSIFGALQDAYRSTCRFYINRWEDGRRQDAYDAVLDGVGQFTHRNFFVVFFYAIWLMLLSIYQSVRISRATGKATARRGREMLINTPRFQRPGLESEPITKIKRK